jgi:hypothetical protein
MIDSYRNNTIHVALFVIGLMGSIFGGFVSVVAAQSPMEMMQGMMMGGGDADGNMTEMKANILKQFNRGTLEIEMPIMCTTPAQVLESLSGMFGNATDIDGNATDIDGNATDISGILESLSGMFGNATDTGDNATKQMMMMEMMQVQNMTEQELKEEMNSLMCVPMTDENMTQSMIEGGMMQ